MLTGVRFNLTMGFVRGDRFPLRLGLTLLSLVLARKLE
jgi:hypothetical protein